ncbi:unnamed protein product [Vitrella brassicaformis CCMP3155]|uniref:Uncharacterized protein n=1 Tax=Vitrella brassicaformis (strain CCMP3155) TaxID=1169540 RepID=A0A0G4EHH1_VITBC|nr:unnamed protein product [Vitrella brassicaformis CCMP3155]|eukprot:CEL95470.1 unnamed protein product [Vitrella brassicaformis CCMP3155]
MFSEGKPGKVLHVEVINHLISRGGQTQLSAFASCLHALQQSAKKAAKQATTAGARRSRAPSSRATVISTPATHGSVFSQRSRSLAFARPSQDNGKRSSTQPSQRLPALLLDVGELAPTSSIEIQERLRLGDGGDGEREKQLEDGQEQMEEDKSPLQAEGERPSEAAEAPLEPPPAADVPFRYRVKLKRGPPGREEPVLSQSGRRFAMRRQPRRSGSWRDRREDKRAAGDVPAGRFSLSEVLTSSPSVVDDFRRVKDEQGLTERPRLRLGTDLSDLTPLVTPKSRPVGQRSYYRALSNPSPSAPATVMERFLAITPYSGSLCDSMMSTWTSLRDDRLRKSGVSVSTRSSKTFRSPPRAKMISQETFRLCDEPPEDVLALMPPSSSARFSDTQDVFWREMETADTGPMSMREGSPGLLPPISERGPPGAADADRSNSEKVDKFRDLSTVERLQMRALRSELIELADSAGILPGTMPHYDPSVHKVHEWAAGVTACSNDGPPDLLFPLTDLINSALATARPPPSAPPRNYRGAGCGTMTNPPLVHTPTDGPLVEPLHLHRKPGSVMRSRAFVGMHESLMGLA